MRITNLFLNLIVGLSTLIFGVIGFGIWQFFVETFDTEELIKTENIKINVPIPISSPTFEPELVKSVSEKKVEDNSVKEFDAGGYYGIIGDYPKGFKDFEMIEIITHESSVKTGSIISIPPKGYIRTNKNFDFKKINANPKKLSFSTEKIKRISYEFNGNFSYEKSEENSEYEERVLNGNLIKKRNGKIIAKAKVKLWYYIGC